MKAKKKQQLIQEGFYNKELMPSTLLGSCQQRKKEQVWILYISLDQYRRYATMRELKVSIDIEVIGFNG